MPENSFRLERMRRLALRIVLCGASFASAGDSVQVFADIRRHLEPSTVTLKESSINLPGSHLRQDSSAYSVEVNVAPPFTLSRGVLGGPLRGAYLLQVVPQFIVRRSDGLPSNPVRTPSYIPSATLFYSPQDSAPARDRVRRYVSFTLSHYSNGETGAFLLPDGRLNNVDGSFSLWSASAALHFENDWPLLPAYKAIRVEHLYYKENLLDALYPDYMISLTLQTADRSRAGSWNLGGRVRARMNLDWRVPTGELPPALEKMKPAPFSGAMTASYAPGWTALESLAFFGRFYAGADYYNMNFDKEIYRIDFGLMLGRY